MLKNSSACFKHSQCSSGFCKKGACAEPTKKHDSCSVSKKNCPVPLHCSEYSRTCVPRHFEIQEGGCTGSSDCSYNEFCIKGQCKKTLLIGKTCKGINPDLCEMGSKCTVASSSKETTKCYELCSAKVPCPSGYNCVENIWNADPICVASTRSSSPPPAALKSQEMIQAVIIVLAVLIAILGGLYGWIRLTRSGKDPRLLSLKDKKKRKRLRLNYEGNGLATITLVPSNCQSPQPVAASELFNSNNNDNSNYMNEAPPAYSEVINIR